MDKCIFLMDLNAFFISCETVRHPELAGKPAAVAGDSKMRSGIILTANYEARAYDVKATMTSGHVRAPVSPSVPRKQKPSAGG